MSKQRHSSSWSPRDRPPAPNNGVQAGVTMSSGTPTSHSVATSSRTRPGVDNQRSDQNTPNSQRAMFSGIERLHIGVGNFTQIINNREDNISKHAVFQSLPRSRDAAFSAAINLDNLARRGCTKDTRVDIIAKIMAWVNEKNPSKALPVYWLTGLAGLGKTTIAYTICERLEEGGVPFASFFCSRQLDSRNPKLLVTTLCGDLAALDNSYAASLLSILETNLNVVDAHLRRQIGELLAKPWQAAIARRLHCNLPTPVVVVDALDENDGGAEFLEELLRVIHGGQLAGIKILVTSRPHPKIADVCESFRLNEVCKLHEVDTANVQNDIEKYLWEALPELKGKPELALLSQRAGGLFIYATTAVRFISPPYSPPSVSEMRSHLQAMLKPEPLTHTDSDERSLVDELYERILGDAFRDSRVRDKRLEILHTIVCAESRINASVCADLTNTDPDTVKRVVESLHAVLFVSPKNQCVYWHHTSFPDFLFSRKRSLLRTYPTILCNAPARHGVLAQRCFSIMQESLHFNMCNLPSSFVFDSEIPGLHVTIKQTFTPTLRYVSRHWARHLLWAAKDANDLLRGLSNFLCNQLLFWIETMNLIGSRIECFSLLKDAESWLKMGKESPDFLRQLIDAANFSAFFAGSSASKSTPHLYISALSMWNQDSPVCKIWRQRFRFIPILRQSGVITIPLLTIPTTSMVTCAAFSPDGRLIVSGSDRSVQIWDARTGEQLRELKGHTDTVWSVALSPDGNQIVSGSGDKSVRVWDAKTGEQLRKLEGHTHGVKSIAFSPDGTRIVSGSHDGSMQVWDTKTAEQLRTLEHTDWVTSVAFSPDGNRIVSGSSDRSVRVWDARTGDRLTKLEGHTSWVRSVAFSPDGNRIVSGSDDGLVRVCDAKTGWQLKNLKEHTSSVISVSFSPDGNRIVSGSNDRSVRLWDARTGKQLRELEGHTDCVRSVAFSPDGNRIVSGSIDKSLRVWDAKTHERLRELEGHTDCVNSVAFSPDGNRIVSGSNDRSVRLWDARTGKQLRELEGNTHGVKSIAFSPDGTRIVSGSSDKSVRVWDAKTAEQLRKLKHTDRVSSVAFSSDGNRVVSGSFDRSVRVWDAKTGVRLRELEGHTSWITSVAFSPGGNRIISGSDDGSVRVWDAKTGEQLKKLNQHTDTVTSVAFSPGGNRIISGSVDGSVRVWDAKTAAQLWKLEHTNRVTSVAFSPDGGRVISGSVDRSVRVWDVKTGKRLRKLEGHTDSVNSVAFSPDGNRIVSGSADKSVRVWDANTGKELRETKDVRFSRDGNLSGSVNRSVQVSTNVYLDPSWVIDTDGWILSGVERFVWVPSTICSVLHRPYNTLIISRNGSASISFTQGKLGNFWYQCYTP